MFVQGETDFSGETADLGPGDEFVAEGPDAELEPDDGGLQATPTDDQVADEDGAPTDNDPLAGVDEELRPILEAKLRNLESGYTKKYQALAEDRKAVKMLREQLEQMVAQRAPQQAGTGAQTEADPDAPWREHDWDMVSPEIRFLAEQVYLLRQDQIQLGRDIYGNIVPAVTQSTKEKQISALQQKYGEVFDMQRLEAAMKKYPNQPLELVAREAFDDLLIAQRRQKYAQNVQAKRRANPVPSSATRLENEPDTSNWDVEDFFEHARRTGKRF